MAGKDKGQTGTIQEVIRKKNAVIVEGKNLVLEKKSAFIALLSF